MEYYPKRIHRKKQLQAESIFSIGTDFGQLINLEEKSLEYHYPEAMLEEYTTLIKLRLDGGKMDIQNILPKY